MENWRTHARLAAVGWLGVGVLSGLLAYVGIANTITSPTAGGLIVAAPIALISLYSAVRLFFVPTAGALLGATFWAGLNLAFGLWAALTGAGLVSLPFLVLVAGSGIESYQAWTGLRSAPST